MIASTLQPPFFGGQQCKSGERLYSCGGCGFESRLSDFHFCSNHDVAADCTTVIQWTDPGQRRGAGDGDMSEERCTTGLCESVDDGCVWGWCLRETSGHWGRPVVCWTCALCGHYQKCVSCSGFSLVLVNRIAFICKRKPMSCHVIDVVQTD